MNSITSKNVRVEDGYRMIECEPIKLGNTTYAVTIQEFDDERLPATTWLRGPRGAEYTLVPETVENTGRYRVISWASGAPLRVKGNEVRVILLGNMIEVAEAPALPYIR